MINDMVIQKYRRRLGNDISPEQGHAVQSHLNWKHKDSNAVPNGVLPNTCSPTSDQL